MLTATPIRKIVPLKKIVLGKWVPRKMTSQLPTLSCVKYKENEILEKKVTSLLDFSGSNSNNTPARPESAGTTPECRIPQATQAAVNNRN